MQYRYGRRAVLDILARLGEQTPEQLEQHLRALEQQPKLNRSKKSKPPLVEIAASECRDRADIADALRTLAVSFENRTFLPNLRDVRRFFERIGAPHGAFKSRTLAGPVLIRTLSKLPREELLGLVAKGGLPGESDYSLLSQAIMGRASRSE